MVSGASDAGGGAICLCRRALARIKTQRYQACEKPRQVPAFLYGLQRHMAPLSAVSRETYAAGGVSGKLYLADKRIIDFDFLSAEFPPAFCQIAIHQHTPYLSMTVAQHLLHGNSWIASITTPPSRKTSNARRTLSSVPISNTLKVIVSHFIL